MTTNLTRRLSWKDIPFRGLIISTLVMNVLTGVGILVARGYLPPVVPLLYGRPLGESQLVPTLGLVIAPAVALGISVLNIFLSVFIQESLTKKILIISGFLVSILSTITILKIILLVGFF